MPQSLKHYRKIKAFIKKLQRLPESAKRKWLLAASALSMIVILGLWFLYLNFSLPSIAEEKPKEQPKKDEEGIGDIMFRGFENLRSDFGERWSAFKGDLSKNLDQLKNQFETRNETIVPEKEFEYVPPPVDAATSTLIR